MKVIPPILTLIIAIALLVSCEPEHPPFSYAVIAIEAENADNSGETIIISDIDSMEADQYTIHLECTNEFRKDNNPGHFHPYETGYINDLSITSFNISALEDFDETHAAGSSLNDYFLTSTSYNAAYSSHSTIDNFVAHNYLGAGRGYSSDTLAEWKSNQFLFLMQAPEIMGEFHFIVDIVQSDEILLTDTTTIKLYE